MLFLNIAFSSSGKLTTRIPYCKNCINNVPVQVDGQAYVVIHNIMPLSFCLCRRGGTISYSVQRIYASFYLLIQEYGICLLICIGKVGLLPLPLGAKLALAGKMRCCCFAHWAGPKLDSCPVFSYSHARACELHFFFPKILCVV